MAHSNRISLETLQDLREKVKAEFDEIEKVSGAEARLSEIQARLQASRDVTDPFSRLEFYVYVISSLVHHIRHRSLPQREIRRLQKEVQNLLQFETVSKERNYLSSVMSDFERAISQIYGIEGHPWLFAWHHQIALVHQRRVREINDSLRYVGLGVRASRLGSLGLALGYFEEALKDVSPSPEHAKARVNIVRILRMQGHFDEAASRANAFFSNESIEKAEADDLKWEQILIEVTQKGAWKPLTHSLRRDSSHFGREYIVDGRLWTLAAEDMRFHESLPKLDTLRNDPDIGLFKVGAAYEALFVIERCYQSSSGLPKRAAELSNAIQDLGKMESFEQELLVLAAVTRWLKRAKLNELYELANDQYRQRCLGATNGAIADCLGVMTAK